MEDKHIKSGVMKDKYIKSIAENISWISIFMFFILVSQCMQCSQNKEVIVNIEEILSEPLADSEDG